MSFLARHPAIVARELIGAQLLLPLYWFLIGIATIRAAIELARQPFHWFKSPHTPYDPHAEAEYPPRIPHRRRARSGKLAQ